MTGFYFCLVRPQRRENKTRAVDDFSPDALPWARNDIVLALSTVWCNAWLRATGRRRQVCALLAWLHELLESRCAFEESRPSLRSEVNAELNFPPNFEGLVLGCIDADFCK